MIDATQTKTKRPAIPTVGVVDDDQSILDSISSLVRSAGYNAAVYESAEAFLYSNGMPQADCLVLDMRMPGLSGLQLQKKLSEMQCLIPVIFVTAHSGDEVRATALGQGAVAFLGKPFHDEALLDAIELATHPAGTQQRV